MGARVREFAKLKTKISKYESCADYGMPMPFGWSEASGGIGSTALLGLRDNCLVSVDPDFSLKLTLMLSIKSIAIESSFWR